MAIHYLSPADYIDKHGFNVWVPFYYQPHLPKELIEPEPFVRQKANPFKKVPVYRRPHFRYMPDHDPDQLQMANYSIKYMLDMWLKKVPFTLVNERDIVDVFDNIDRYLMSVKFDVEDGHPQIIDYVKKLLSLREEAYKNYYRYMRKNPAQLEMLYPNGSIDNNLFSLLAKIPTGSNKHIEFDPLKAREKPPYEVEKPVVEEKNEADKENSFEGSFGIASSDMDLSDLSNFDYDEFIGRSK